MTIYSLPLSLLAGFSPTLSVAPTWFINYKKPVTPFLVLNRLQVFPPWDPFPRRCPQVISTLATSLQCAGGDVLLHRSLQSRRFSTISFRDSPQLTPPLGVSCRPDLNPSRPPPPPNFSYDKSFWWKLIREQSLRERRLTRLLPSVFIPQFLPLPLIFFRCSTQTPQLFHPG